MLLRIMSHLGLPSVSVTEPTQPITRDQSAVSITAASLDMLAAVTAASDPPTSTHHKSEVVALPSLAFSTQWRYGYTLVGGKS